MLTIVEEERNESPQPSEGSQELSPEIITDRQRELATKVTQHFLFLAFFERQFFQVQCPTAMAYVYTSMSFQPYYSFYTIDFIIIIILNSRRSN